MGQHIIMMISIAKGLLMTLFKYAATSSALNHVGTVAPTNVQQFFFANGQRRNICLKVSILWCKDNSQVYESNTMFFFAVDHEYSAYFIAEAKRILSA
jgi:hypothetical protein